jgi:hypothetical protein
MTELERYIETGEVEITRHPITNIRRLLKEDLFIHNQRNKEISIEFKVIWLDENGEVINKTSMPSYSRTLTADRFTSINPQTMEVVEEGGVTEYDFFVGIANNPVNIFQVRLDTIKMRAAQGKFDI